MQIIRRNNALTPWVGDINSLFDHFEREIESAFRGFDAGLVPIFEGKYSYPKVNIVSKENEYVIEAAVPGLEKDNINLEIKEQDGKKVLEISGKKGSEEREEKINFVRREIKYSSFLRSFYLPENIVEEKIEAKCQNGILEIKIPILNSNLAPKEEKKVIAIR